MKTKSVFRYFNGAFLALTLFLAAGFLAANYRAALADVEDGVCANEIHDRQAGGTSSIDVPNQQLCQLSSPWYGGGIMGVGQSGPYYNCCRYEGTAQYSYVSDGGPDGYGTYVYTGGDWYFRDRQLGDSRCDPQANCVYQ